jgi:hypothetical protein
MQLIVTAGDADLPITWCGKTWVASTETPGVDEVHSGEPHCVCPTYYVDADPYGPPFPTLTSLSYRSGARQNWHFNSEINIDAFWEFPVTLLAPLNAQLENRINVRNGGMVWHKARRHQYTATNQYPAGGTTLGGILSATNNTGFVFSVGPPSLTGNANVSTYGLLAPFFTKTTLGNTVSTAPFSRTMTPINEPPANMNGRIDNGFFGRVTTTSGVTYEWAQGQRW